MKAYLVGHLLPLLGHAALAAAAASGVLLRCCLSTSFLKPTALMPRLPVKASQAGSKARYVLVLVPFLRVMWVAQRSFVLRFRDGDDPAQSEVRRLLIFSAVARSLGGAVPPVLLVKKEASASYQDVPKLPR